MRTSTRHLERHRGTRIGWLRAAVLGANDGLVSTASLVLGVAVAGVAHAALLMTAWAGLIAGAMSMAAGEYISVHSQRDTENADLDRERRELERDPQGELRELTGIYVARGLDANLATQVAQQLMAHDALGAHARDELGASPATAANPNQAALTSAASFAAGAALPLAMAAVCPSPYIIVVVAGGTTLALAGLGAIAAHLGGAPLWRGCWRVTFWGALAMAVTSGAGALFGAVA